MTPTLVTITCPVCGTTSHHPTDVTEGYCGACHAWTGTTLPDPTDPTEGDLMFRDAAPAVGVGATITYRPLTCFPHVVQAVDDTTGVAYLWPLDIDPWTDTAHDVGSGILVHHHTYTDTEVQTLRSQTATLVKVHRRADGTWVAPHGHRVTFGLALFFSTGR